MTKRHLFSVIGIVLFYFVLVYPQIFVPGQIVRLSDFILPNFNNRTNLDLFLYSWMEYGFGIPNLPNLSMGIVYVLSSIVGAPQAQQIFGYAPLLIASLGMYFFLTETKWMKSRFGAFLVSILYVANWALLSDRASFFTVTGIMWTYASIPFFMLVSFRIFIENSINIRNTVLLSLAAWLGTFNNSQAIVFLGFILVPFIVHFGLERISSPERDLSGAFRQLALLLIGFGAVYFLLALPLWFPVIRSLMASGNVQSLFGSKANYLPGSPMYAAFFPKIVSPLLLLSGPVSPDNRFALLGIGMPIVMVAGILLENDRKKKLFALLLMSAVLLTSGWIRMVVKESRFVPLVYDFPLLGQLMQPLRNAFKYFLLLGPCLTILFALGVDASIQKLKANQYRMFSRQFGLSLGLACLAAFGIFAVIFNHGGRITQLSSIFMRGTNYSEQGGPHTTPFGHMDQLNRRIAKEINQLGGPTDRFLWVPNENEIWVEMTQASYNNVLSYPTALNLGRFQTEIAQAFADRDAVRLSKILSFLNIRFVVILKYLKQSGLPRIWGSQEHIVGDPAGFFAAFHNQSSFSLVKDSKYYSLYENKIAGGTGSASSLMYLDGAIESLRAVCNLSDFKPGKPFALLSAPGVHPMFLKDLAAGAMRPDAGSEAVVFDRLRIDDFALDLARNEALGGEKDNEVASVKPAMIRFKDSFSEKIKVIEAGRYEFWLAAGNRVLEDISAMKIDGMDFYFPKERTEVWRNVINIDLTVGAHEIELIPRNTKARRDLKGLGTLELLILNSEKLQSYKQKSSEASVRYYFANEGSETFIKRDFFVPRDGRYQFSTRLRSELNNIPFFIDGLSKTVMNSGKKVSGALMLFGEGFFLSEKMFYPLEKGTWRWMRTQGKILLINPAQYPISARVDLNVVSFGVGRRLAYHLNGEAIGQVFVGEKIKSKSILSMKGFKMIPEVGTASSRPVSFSESLVLKPGLNELVLTAEPGAGLLNEKIPLSVAVQGGVSFIEETGSLNSAWSNSPQFRFFQKDDQLMFDGAYDDGDKVAWVSRSLSPVNLFDYPKIEIDYTASSALQSMDIGFRVETGKPGAPLLFFTRRLPPPFLDGQILQFDLLDEVWKEDDAAVNPRLVGMDFVTHTAWDVETMLPRNSRAFFFIDGIRFKLRYSAMPVLAEETLEEVASDGPPDAFFFENDGRVITGLTTNDRWPESSSLKVTIPMDKRPDQARGLIIPVRLDNWDWQDVKLFIGWDNNADGRVDVRLPVGTRKAVSDWRSLRFSSTHEVSRPSGLRSWGMSEKLFSNFIFSNGKDFFLPAGENGFLRGFNSNVSGSISVKHDRVEIPVSSETGSVDKSEIYISPQADPSYFFHHFKDIFVDLENGPGVPLELDVFLQTSRDKGNLYKDVRKTNGFSIRRPMYVGARLYSQITTSQELPSMRVDGVAVQPTQKYFTGEGFRADYEVPMKKGMHRLGALRLGSIAIDSVEIAELSPQQKPADQDDFVLKKINPTKYIGAFTASEHSKVVVLNQSYHNSWRAFLLVPGQKKKQLGDHFQANGYSNAWRIPELAEHKGKPCKIVVEYTLQPLMTALIIVSMFALLICVWFVVARCCIKRTV